MIRAYSSSIRVRRLVLIALSLTLSIAFSLFVSGCASTGSSPIESRSQPPTKKINTHIVEPGDTLYSIAWRYETDYKELAAINGIRSPYTIFRGQKLKLSGSALKPVSRGSSSSSTISTRTVPNRTTTTSSSTTAAANSPTTSTASVANNTSASMPKAPSVPSSVQGWNWPLNGKVVKPYGSNSLTRGITIDSSTQKDVKAAAEGVVVYSGSGVRGYGNFLILKHSDLYLSAYAYNSKLLAKEGDQVRKGQRIAVAGKDIDGKPRLYFEIRKDGKPVDPIRYLPKR